jgi:4'-phosphopantetheinyl transferase
MQNKTVVYLIKDFSSAALKRAATRDYFGEAEISYLENGKPIIKSPEGYFISVSHSFGIAAVVISDKPIGIDIEKIREFDFSRMKKGFLSEKEAKKVNTLEGFFDVWVKKEAEVKISGEGIFSVRKKEGKAVYTNLSSDVSAFAGEPFSACLASFSPLQYEIKEL